MKDVDKVKLKIQSTIKDALIMIDIGAIKIAVIVDDDDKLIGTLTDGDIRRAILDGKTLQDSIEEIYYKTPTFVSINESRENVIKLCTSRKIHQIPVVDEEGRVVSIELLDELLTPIIQDNKVILMVGGLGTRLKPLTENIPKPMLHVGNKPILQTIVEKFSSYGFVDIIMCVNYKSHIIQDYFGDGSQFGVNIEYILEDKRMGTAGALSLLKEKPVKPFFVMNGDLLTNVNFEHLLEFHQVNHALATMCVREYDFQVPYGVVDIENHQITRIVEKPVHKFFVSGGIYLLDAEVLGYIPENTFYDMPSLFDKLIADKQKALSFPIQEYWLDIGRMSDFEQANNEYKHYF